METVATIFQIVLFTANWFQSAANNSTILIAKPQNVTVEEGHGFLLECKFKDRKAPCLWTRNGTIFIPSDNAYQNANDNDCTILITNAQYSIHDAFYRCGYGSSVLSDPPAKVSILVKPEYPEILRKKISIPNGGNLIISEKDSYLVITCMVRNGNPEASIQWIMDSKELPANATIINNASKLKTIQSELILNAKDSKLQYRTLQCNAIHPLYNSSSNHKVSTQVKIVLPGVVVNVTAEFIINTSAKRINVAVGRFVDMNCKAIGDNIQKYVWEKRRHEKSTWESFDNKSTTTHIAENAVFRCGVKSTISNSNFVHSDEIQVELDLSDILTVISHPQDKIVNNSEDVLLDCIFSRRPLRCDWLKDGHPFIPDGDIYIFVGNIEMNDCSIRIKSVNANLEATYTCESPGVGKEKGARSQTAKVTIIQMPQSPEIWYQERVLGTGENLKVNYNDPVISVYCRVKDGNPAAQLQWFVNNVQHYGFVRNDISSENSNWITTTNTLNITITEDMKYKGIRCRAMHSAYIGGKSETYAILSILSPTTVTRAYIPGIDIEKSLIVEPEVTVTIFCEANGDPEPDYEWKFHDHNSEFNWILSSNEQNITVKNKPGIYTCTARNEFNIISGFSVSNSIKIEIEYPHKVTLGVIAGVAAACMFVLAFSFGLTLYACNHQIWCFKKVKTTKL